MPALQPCRTDKPLSGLLQSQSASVVLPLQFTKPAFLPSIRSLANMSLRQCQPERLCPLTGPAVRCRESSLVMQRWLVVPAIARIMWNLQHLLFLPTHSIIHCAKVFLHTFSKIWRALLLSVNFCVWLTEVCLFANIIFATKIMNIKHSMKSAVRLRL